MVYYRVKNSKKALISLFFLLFASCTLFPMHRLRLGRITGNSAQYIHFSPLESFSQRSVRYQGPLSNRSCFTHRILSVHTKNYESWQPVNTGMQSAVISLGTAAKDYSAKYFIGSSLLVGIAAGCVGNAKQDDALENVHDSPSNVESTSALDTKEQEAPITQPQELSYEERRVKAQKIKELIDAQLLDCLGRDYWSTDNKKIQFAQTVDACLKTIQGFEHLIDECEDIFFLNKPADWRHVSAQEVIKALLDVRNEGSIKNISNKLYYLFYLLPQELQNDWKSLGIRLYYRLGTGNPGTEISYVNPFEKKEQAELR